MDLPTLLARKVDALRASSGGDATTLLSAYIDSVIADPQYADIHDLNMKLAVALDAEFNPPPE